MIRTNQKNRILLGDCLELMKDIPDKSIDMILADLPYGTTNCEWDFVIPLEPLWKQYRRIIKDNGAIVLFAQEPFTSILISSNLNEFRYKWIWEKMAPTGHLNAHKMPMKWYEEIAVFYKSLPTYNPQLRKGKGYKTVLSSIKSKNYGTQRNMGVLENDGTQYMPKDIIIFNNVNGIEKKIHSTQKPVALCEYFIKTYSNEGDIVLDNVAGSGTTAIACLNTKKRFIIMEKDKMFYSEIIKRIKEHIGPLYYDESKFLINN